MSRIARNLIATFLFGLLALSAAGWAAGSAAYNFSGTLNSGGASGNSASYAVVSAASGSNNGAFSSTSYLVGGGFLFCSYSIASALPPSYVLDDFEGLKVGPAGYYVFGAGVTPDNANINAQGPSADAAFKDSRGMKVSYSYSGGTGGGWGAKLANTIDLTGAALINFYVRWDGSANAFKLVLKDSDGTANSCVIPNAVLTGFSKYGQLSISVANFNSDAARSDPGSNSAFDWSKIAGYEFEYKTRSAATGYQFFDLLAATVGSLSPSQEAPVVVFTDPAAAGPAGSGITINGLRFGTPQGNSLVVFDDPNTGLSYQAEVLSWSDTVITARVPALAAAGNYTIRVIRQGNIFGQQSGIVSNVVPFQVSAAAVAGAATIYPNPFNAGKASVNIVVPTIPSGTTNIGFYLYNVAAQLVYKQVISSPNNSITWSGLDSAGALVGNGTFLVRIIDEDSRALLAKGKILVIKQ
jgi:hypothetical protein